MVVQIDKTAVLRIMGAQEMTGKALAEKMGLTPQALSIALNRETFSHINAAKLADALGVPYEAVLKEVKT